MKFLKKLILENKSLRWLLIFTNWVYQGIPQSDTSEKIYKISLTILFSLLSFFILSFSNLYILNHAILSLIIGHSLNWIINSNQSVIFIHRMKWLKTSPKKLFAHLNSIQERLITKDWILFSISLGGISRGTMNTHSDIDVNIIRKPGFKNAIRALLFGTIEKKRADFNGIPLDFIVSDSVEDCIIKTDGQKNPVVMYDPYNLIDDYYDQKMTIGEAQILNNVIIKI